MPRTCTHYDPHCVSPYPHPGGEEEFHPPPGFDRIVERRMKKRQNGYKMWQRAQSAAATLVQSHPL